MRTIGHLPPYEGEATRHVAMPLGGIGTGNIAVCGDGSLRQWQLHNVGNHEGFIPDSFFALRVSQGEPPVSEVRLLQAEPLPPAEPTPLMTDDLIPAGQSALTAPRMASTTFRGIYPFAEVDFHDESLPVTVTMEAYTPLVPLDVEASSLPVALFTFTLTNRTAIPAYAWLGATLQNAVGWDGVTPIDGTRCPLYGGNVNRLSRQDGWATLIAENPSLPVDHPGAGQLVLSIDDENATALVQWDHPDQFFRFLRGRAYREVLEPGRFPRTVQADPQSSGPAAAYGPSASGTTWNGGLCAAVPLGPNETATVRCVLAWHFPNRYMNFDQYGPRRDYGHSRFWLGNAYARTFTDARAAAEHAQKNWRELREASLNWTQTLLDSSLPDTTAERLAAQAVVLRSPTCFRDAEGRFFGFEGVLGASTNMWSGDHGGSCPLNCTHVWNYAQAVARLFPELERNMRETEFDIAQAPEGYLPHRVIAPVYMRQLWDVPIGGPSEPALDGMLGAILKTYREVRLGAGPEWSDRYWPHIRRLLDYVRGKWDPDGTGVLRGIQPSTHDIDLCGINPFMGTLWLAALKAAARLAELAGDGAYAKEVEDLARQGSESYDAALWNGEFYQQVLEPGDGDLYQWGAGCLADQLVGQWWAHQLDLGYVLPPEHVRQALQAVVRHNLRTGFRDLVHDQRVYADLDDSGLLMCTWPQGGRPATPVRYCDEVWSGVEYQVAAHCLAEGLTEEGTSILDALWRRHDGRRRNPYNEIECGDHYARSLAGWSVLESLNGVVYDHPSRTLTLRKAAPGRYPYLVAGGWGTVDTTITGRVSVYSRGGCLEIGALVCHTLPGSPTVTRHDDDGPVLVPAVADETGVITPQRPVRLPAGTRLDIAVPPMTETH